MRKLPRAILFDADGTLYDSERLNFEANRVTAKELYDFDFPLEDFERRIVRGPDSTLDILRDYGIAADADSYFAARHVHHKRLVNKHLQPFPGLVAFLDWCRGQDITCVIVSASRLGMIENGLAATGIRQYFKTVISIEDVGADQKPHPLGYRLGLKAAGFRAGQALAIEDTAKGIASAQAAGLRCIGIRNGTNSEAELAAAGYVISDYSELKTYLGF